MNEVHENGYLIHWYNLNEDNDAEYLEWLHGEYIPRRLNDPRILWACHFKSLDNVTHPGEKGRLSHDNKSIPAGDRYILIFGAKKPEIFADPTVTEYHQSLSEKDLMFLKMKREERYNIMTEEARGPGSEKKPIDGVGLSECIQLGNFNSGSYEDEDELASWYATWRIPSMKKLPGCQGVRKLVSVSGWAKHAILYEWASPEARNSTFVDHEMENPKMEEWTDRVVRKLVHAPGSPNLARRIWPIIE
tara:strand:+ start:1200 stop:1940 length:741 start_codon:yes stop_codon:yes gene_type:complete